MTTKAIGYVRVSTEEQATEGVSLEAQRARVEAYAIAAGLELVAIVEDAGLSGKSLARPGVVRVLEALENGDAGALIVYKLDRLSRSTSDTLELVERSGAEGWTLHSICERLDTSSAAGRFFVTMIAGLAQMEREQIVERTNGALAHLRATGKRTGAVPYGFDVIDTGSTSKAGLPNTLSQNAEEAAIIERIAELAAAGMSRRAIAGELNAANVATKNGAAWSHVQVGRVLARGRA